MYACPCRYARMHEWMDGWLHAHVCTYGTLRVYRGSEDCCAPAKAVAGAPIQSCILLQAVIWGISFLAACFL